MKVKSQSEVAQSCPTPRDPMDCSPPGSSTHAISQARVLEGGAIGGSISKVLNLIHQVEMQKDLYNKDSQEVMSLKAKPQTA